MVLAIVLLLTTTRIAKALAVMPVTVLLVATALQGAMPQGVMALLAVMALMVAPAQAVTVGQAAMALMRWQV